MFSLALKSVRSNATRFLLTGIAVILGVAFMAGTLVLTSTIRKAYDDVTTNVYKTTDAVVRSNRDVKSMQGGTDQRGTVNGSVLQAVRSAKGVQAAVGQQSGVAMVVAHDGKLLDANRNRAVPIALGWVDTPALNPMHVVAGNAPRAPTDVVIDRASFDHGGYRLGETVRVVTQAGSQPYRLTGVVTYGGSNTGTGGAEVVGFSASAAGNVLGTAGRYAMISVTAAPGVSQQQLATNIRAAIHDGNVEVLTGTAAANDARQASGTSLQFINMFLMVFAIVALVVGSFVIYNTFSITLAQRTKDTALLRAIGANRKQVRRAVLIEAAFIGVIASAIGVVAGIGIAEGLRYVLQAFGLELPAAATVIEPSAVVISMLTGVVVTIAAAYIPGRRAAKVAPIEALRDTAAEATRVSKRRTTIGALSTAFGAYGVVQGVSGAGAGAVGMGALGVFLGVTMLGPVIARPFARIIGAPLPRLRGMAGTLARENATRNPRRTSATASALMIGVGLVALITVFAASAKTSMANGLDKAMKADWIVETQYNMGGLSPSVAPQLDALPETRSVTAMRFSNATVAGSVVDITAVDPASAQNTIDFDVRSGSMAHLGRNDVAVQVDEAKKRHVNVGDVVTLNFAETGAQQMHVTALYKTKQPLGPYSMSIETLDANMSTHADNVLLVSSSHGASTAQVRHAITQSLHDYPTATLLTKNEFKGEMANRINQILNLVYVLLAMALVIALFGIANTLALSVYERTREIGLLRAVGMGRRQVRSTVRWESVLIALLGTVLGTAIGLGFGWALVQASAGQGINQFVVPVTQLAAIVVFAAGAAVLAAALPARRASRLDVLEAISN